ncbi:MAG: DNA alkylation repair protein [Planctomycetes bacterium]|nr:DNA alkylation repair protein [Planctomycetota bacterium]
MFSVSRLVLKGVFSQCVSLTGLLILVAQFEHAKDEESQRRVVEVYMRNLDHVNNWDLVDSTAHKILGAWLAERDRDVLDELAASGHLWRERISVVACLHFIKHHDFDDILRLAEQFLDHSHDLIHKAVGWMLREAGNRDEQILEGFLSKHYSKMPRTMLRYAIERLKPARRKAYLEGRV